MNKTLLAAAAVTLFATSTPICAQQMTTKQQLIGTWNVDRRPMVELRRALTGQARLNGLTVYDGNRLIMKSPGVIVPMTGALSIVEIELVKAE